MSKYLIGIAVALATMATAGLAQADPIQTLEASISKTKLDKKKPKSVGLFIDIKTFPNTGAAANQDQPPSATRTVVDFPKNLSFDTEAVPHCAVPPEALQNTTADQAIELCGKKSVISVPGKTSAHVTADLLPGVADPNAVAGIPVELTAFNGAEPDTLIFHNRADTVNTTTILLETLKKAKGVYGTSLITEIPPIAAGAPDDFKVTIKSGTLVSAVCKTTKNPFRVTTAFTNYSAPEATFNTETKCTQKKSKKK